jgi:hypothetical protein
MARAGMCRRPSDAPRNGGEPGSAWSSRASHDNAATHLPLKLVRTEAATVHAAVRQRHHAKPGAQPARILADVRSAVGAHVQARARLDAAARCRVGSKVRVAVRERHLGRGAGAHARGVQAAWARVGVGAQAGRGSAPESQQGSWGIGQLPDARTHARARARAHARARARAPSYASRLATSAVASSGLSPPAGTPSTRARHTPRCCSSGAAQDTHTQQRRVALQNDVSAARCLS